MKYRLITEDENRLIRHGLFDSPEAALEHLTELFETDLSFDPEDPDLTIEIKEVTI